MSLSNLLSSCALRINSSNSSFNPSHTVLSKSYSLKISGEFSRKSTLLQFVLLHLSLHEIDRLDSITVSQIPNRCRILYTSLSCQVPLCRLSESLRPSCLLFVFSSPTTTTPAFALAFTRGFFIAPLQTPVSAFFGPRFPILQMENQYGIPSYTLYAMLEPKLSVTIPSQLPTQLQIQLTFKLTCDNGAMQISPE